MERAGSFSLFRRLVSFVFVIVIVVFAYEAFTVQGQEKLLDQQSQALAKNYADLSVATAGPLLQTSGITANEKKGLNDLKEEATTVMQPSSIKDRLLRISTMQTSFTALTHAPSSALSARSEFQSITKAMVDTKSDINTSLTSYNNTAQLWNNHWKQTIGGLTVNLLGKERLYLLNPDGKTEYTTTVQL